MKTREDHKIPEKPKRDSYPSGEKGGYEWLLDTKIYQDHQIQILEYAINLMPSDIKEKYIKEARSDYRKGINYN